MTQNEPRSREWRRILTQGMTQAVAALVIAGVLGAATLACGRYGPPQPYPPGQEVPDDDEDQQ